MIDWQFVTVLVVVTVCAGLLVNRVVKWYRQPTGGCNRCSRQTESSQSVKVKPLTQISFGSDQKKT